MQRWQRLRCLPPIECILTTIGRYIRCFFYVFCSFFPFLFSYVDSFDCDYFVVILKRFTVYRECCWPFPYTLAWVYVYYVCFSLDFVCYLSLLQTKLCVCVLWMEARTVRDTFTNNKQVNVILSQRYLFRTFRLCVCISWMISSDDHCFGNSLASTMTFRLPRERSIIGLGYTIVIFNAFAAGQQPLIRLLWTTAMSNCLLFYVR